MKKHIIGLALFSFIVSAAAIGYSFFYVELVKVSAPQHNPGGIIACDMKGLREKITGGAKLKQATLNRESGLFVFEIGCIESPKRISLFFYKKEGRNTQLIATEEFYLDTTANCGNSSSIYKNFAWAKEINRASNIYVIARASDTGKKFSTNFDESLAVPILMEGNGGLIID